MPGSHTHKFYDFIDINLKHISTLSFTNHFPWKHMNSIIAVLYIHNILGRPCTNTHTLFEQLFIYGGRVRVYSESNIHQHIHTHAQARTFLKSNWKRPNLSCCCCCCWFYFYVFIIDQKPPKSNIVSHTFSMSAK